MNLHPDPITEPISIRQAIGKDGWIDYRRGYGAARVTWQRYEFARPCLSIRKSWMGWKPTIEGRERRFSQSEAKTLQSFPESFEFTGNYFQIWQRLGNSMPPLLMFCLARHIRTAVLGKLLGIGEEVALRTLNL